MGIYFGIPQHLVLWLKARASIGTFIETGTYQGGTTRWASEHFARVISIEADPVLHARAKERLAAVANADLRLGRSEESLRAIVPKLSSPALVWLDAHWCCNNTAGEEDECPILEEIAAVDAGAVQHFIMIDDARLFLNPPPPPHKADHWPSVGDVAVKLRARFRDAYIYIGDDVIMRLPSELGPPFEQFISSASEPGAVGSGVGRRVYRRLRAALKRA